MSVMQQSKQPRCLGCWTWVWTLAVFFLWGGEATSSWATPSQIPMWVRAKGNYTSYTRPAYQGLHMVVVPRSSWKTVKMFDLQYKKKMRYQGISLPRLLRLYRYPAGVDMALLLFKNKMAVPYPLKLMKQHKKFPVFLAFARWSKKSKQWVNTFPIVSKKSPYYYRDVRPIRFRGNKLVVSRAWHPFTKGKVAKSFTVWRHVDTLRAIEFVDRAAYYRQFAVAKTKIEKRGASWFYQACQFCHGARDIGAGFGWDFVTPLPIYKYRQSNRLYMHIKFRKSDAALRGLMMPAIRSMTQKDAVMLWHWLRAIGSRSMKPYHPKYSK